MGRPPTGSSSLHRAAGTEHLADDPSRGPAHKLARVLRLVARAWTGVPAWLVALLIAPHVVPGGTSNPWDPAMPYARAMWFTGHQLVGFQQIYLSPDPASGMIFPVSSVGAGLSSVMALGSWFGWQLVFLALAAGSLTWLVARCAGLSGWRLALASAVIMAATAPTRVCIGQGTLDLLMLALVVAGVWPRRTTRRHPALGLGAAASVWLGPLLAVLAMIGCWRRGKGRHRASIPGEPVARSGLVALAAALLLTVCALLALPWATNDFWWLARRGAAGVPTGLNPSLGARAGVAGWLVGGLAGLVGLAMAVAYLRTKRTAQALGWLCLVMVVSVPAQFAGQGSPALVTGLLALRLGFPRLQRVALLVWSGWTCLVPLDMLGRHWTPPGGVALALTWVGPLLGLLALGLCAARGWRRCPRCGTNCLTE